MAKTTCTVQQGAFVHIEGEFCGIKKSRADDGVVRKLREFLQKKKIVPLNVVTDVDGEYKGFFTIKDAKIINNWFLFVS